VPPPDRIFLDANVLFSASYKFPHLFLRFWTEARLHPVSSEYVVAEARRHAASEVHRTRLEGLLAKTELIASHGDVLPPGVVLPGKDRPIFCGALAARARYLVTGDKVHFGRYFGQARAGRGSLERLHHVLSKVSDAPAEANDQL